MKSSVRLLRPMLSLALGLLLGGGCSHKAPPPVPAPGMEDLAAALKRYVEETAPLRDRAEQRTPKGSTPEEQATALERRQEDLAQRIRALRPRAKPGDLFSPAGTTAIKRSLESAFRGPGAATIRDALEEQNDPSLYRGKAHQLVMNGRISAPLIPAVLTVDLPPLPRQFEYRFLGRTLLLTDADANCVVDYIPDAFPLPPPAAPPSPSSQVQQEAATSFLAMPRKARSVRFAALGDTGTGGVNQSKVAQMLFKYYSQGNRFKFILLLGDNLYAGLESARDYRRQFLEPYKPFLDARVQFHAALGNHDLAAQVDFAPFSMGGHPYYSFKERNARFVALNTNEPADPEQRRWFDQQFAGQNEWRICFFHHPLYSSGRHAGESREIRAWLEEDLVRNRVNVVFSGHEHFYERSKPQRGIQYFVDGGAARVRIGDFRPSEFTAFGYDAENSVMVLEIAEDEMFFQALGISGRTLDCGVTYRTPEASANGSRDPSTQAWLRECSEARRWLKVPSVATRQLSPESQSR